MKDTTLAYVAATGDKVSGLYYGVRFSGTVSKKTWRPDASNTCFVFVDLDTPIETQLGITTGVCLQYSETDYLADRHYIDEISYRATVKR